MSAAHSDLGDIRKKAPWIHRLPFAAVVIMAVLVLAYAFTFSAFPVNESPSAWGAFGDHIGGLLNPLVSLFTLMVAVQVWALQKSELSDTRKALEEQGRTAEQQRREQRFFDFLSIYRSTVDAIEFEVSNKSGIAVAFKGKRAFKHLTSRHSHNPLIQVNDILPGGHPKCPTYGHPNCSTPGAVI